MLILTAVSKVVGKLTAEILDVPHPHVVIGI